MARRVSGGIEARVRGAGEALRPASSFGAWCREVSPRMAWDWAHLRLLRAVLERVDPRAPDDPVPVPLLEWPHLVLPRQIKRLQLSLPPQHGKSEQVTIRWPAWLLERDRHLRIIVGSYNQTFAEKFSRRTRRLIERRVPLSRDRNTAMEWEVEPGTRDAAAQDEGIIGGLRAAGVGGGITGYPGDVLLIDDPVKSRAEAESRAYRERCYEWYTDDLYTRLGEHAPVVLIMTRWHHDDLAGRVVGADAAGRWVRLNLPALAEDDDPLGRAPGEALCPERFSRAALLDKQATIPNFLSLYQGRPTPAEGALVSRGWFRRYSVRPINPLRVVQSWDCATSDDPTADYSVCTTWAQTAQGHYLIDVLRSRMTYPALERQARVEAQRWQPSTVLIEDKSHGRALLQSLRADRTWRVPTVAIVPVESKVVRMAVESSAVEAGLVWVPEDGGAAWLAEYLDEMIQFPATANDDQVDSTSQYLRWVRGGDRQAGYTWLSLPR